MSNSFQLFTFSRHIFSAYFFSPKIDFVCCVITYLIVCIENKLIIKKKWKNQNIDNIPSLELRRADHCQLVRDQNIPIRLLS